MLITIENKRVEIMKLKINFSNLNETKVNLSEIKSLAKEVSRAKAAGKYQQSHTDDVKTGSNKEMKQLTMNTGKMLRKLKTKKNPQLSKIGVAKTPAGKNVALMSGPAVKKYAGAEAASSIASFYPKSYMKELKVKDSANPSEVAKTSERKNSADRYKTEISQIAKDKSKRKIDYAFFDDAPKKKEPKIEDYDSAEEGTDAMMDFVNSDEGKKDPMKRAIKAVNNREAAKTAGMTDKEYRTKRYNDMINKSNTNTKTQGENKKKTVLMNSFTDESFAKPLLTEGNTLGMIFNINFGALNENADILSRYGVEGYNKPKKTPSHKTKSHLVVAKKDDKVKVIRFGAQGAKGSPKKEGESESYKKRRQGFVARHKAQNPTGLKDKFSALYWANKVKW